MIKIQFYAYQHEFDDGPTVIFEFFLLDKDGFWTWDEDKLSAAEALNKYPMDKYIWESFDPDEDWDMEQVDT